MSVSFGKRVREGWRQRGTCSAWAGNGQKGCSQSSPLVMGLCWWILRGKPQMWEFQAVCCCCRTELGRSGAEEQRCQKACQKPPWICSNNLHNIINAPWHFWAWGMRGGHGILGSCSNALTGQQYFGGFVLYPYKLHVINPLNLWVPNAWLKERKF